MRELGRLRHNTDLRSRSEGRLSSVALAKEDWRNTRELRLAYASDPYQTLAQRLGARSCITFIYCAAFLTQISAMSASLPISKNRFKSHNEGASIHTAKYRPWKLVAYMAFEDMRKAREFEHYLKSGSGKAFANKRLW